MSSINTNINTHSSSKKKWAPLFADSEEYEYDTTPPSSPVRSSAGKFPPSPPISDTNLLPARTRVRKGPPRNRLEDSDGTHIVVSKKKAAAPASATASPAAASASATASLAAASASATANLAPAPPMGNAESDVNFSGLSPPLPNAFVQPFPLAWNSGFHVVTAGSKVGITAHSFVPSSLQDFFILLTTQLTGQSPKMHCAANVLVTRN